MPSFSKGSAAHINGYKALESAILEAIEADAFMLNWYTKKKAKKIRQDNIEFMEISKKNSWKDPYDLTLYDMSMDGVPGYVFAAQLINKKKNPLCTHGLFGQFEPNQSGISCPCRSRYNSLFGG